MNWDEEDGNQGGGRSSGQLGAALTPFVGVLWQS
jgi:hypothetical protein